MDIKYYVGNPRIIDYSFSLSKLIVDTKPKNTKELSELYQYNLSLCTGINALYPESNWQPHRTCLMSAIAYVLNDLNLVKECEKLAINWISASNCNCCEIRSKDYHYRDSLEYVVYGWWALAQTFVYLQKITKKSYKRLFNNYFAWLKQYEDGTKIHIEFVNSKNIPNDKSKPSYGKKFNPDYSKKTFMNVYNTLF